MTGALRADNDRFIARPAVRLMGGFSVSGGEGLVDLPADARRLVAFLALRRERVPRAFIAGTLWIEGSQDRAFGNLRSALWRLGRVAGRLVDGDTQTLCLSSDATIDIDAVVQAGTQICSDDPEVSSPDCDPEIFTRELLPGWYDEWAIVERERMRQLCLHALEAMAGRLSMRARYAPALQVALAAIRLDPLRESAHRCLIRIHLAEGNSSEAIRSYHEYRERIASDLGIEPSPQLCDLLRSSDLV